MNIMLVAQCNKRALPETRRILDQFAERRGERTWQTAITLEGLNTLRKLLRKTARRNTAVACHWIKGANQTELLWIIGNQRQFNRQGAVPTNRTARDIVKSSSENQWHSAESISLLAAIAGLFHDFGKANSLFQRGLTGLHKGTQPYRHEWVSLRLFQSWVNGRQDKEWLTALANISAEDEAAMLSQLVRDSLTSQNLPFAGLPPLATTVGWLIVSHHRLPAWQGADDNQPDLQSIDGWLNHSLDAGWNAANHWRPDQTAAEFQAVWTFPAGTPMRSALWCAKARKFGQRALKLPSLLHHGMLSDGFTSHLSRLVLMLADHHYSSMPATTGWQDRHYPVYANTDKKTSQLKQQLDEHNIGVGQNALLLGRSLPYIRQTLPAITRHKGFKQRSGDEKYLWQNKAFDLTSALRERSQQQGFFGVNMASTGCGKTFANARIMYALADEQQGCRFTVALGLRTLTLQTGDALRNKLCLQEDDLGVLIGSDAVTQLHQKNQEMQRKSQPQDSGSASSEALFSEHHYVSYQGSLDDGRLSHWLKNSTVMNKLLSAPILVCTLDHLINATEGVRGGKQIAPMLRLLTADLVLDEPDEFGDKDLPALCRLVYQAGMLGSRVLLSSATLPPGLVQSLFNAYRHGREQFQQACGQPGQPVNICCAWYDEYRVQQADLSDGKSFSVQHQAFVEQRIVRLRASPVFRRAELIPLPQHGNRLPEVAETTAAVLLREMQQLHNQHHQQNLQGIKISFGLVRIANIEPLVAIARRLISSSPAADFRIHYCVYHSQHPLAVRSHIEQRLDSLLTRYDPQAIWQAPEVRQSLNNFPEKNQLFVVIATAVAEVGRDHDYDWAIAEPSSVRSLIQLAGRVRRHRPHVCESANVLILEKNVKAMRGNEIAYCRPGFESKDIRLNSHHLHDILKSEQYQIINAIPAIQERKPLDPCNNLADLQHAALRLILQGRKDRHDYYAALWWKTSTTWSAEHQRRTPFRQSAPEQRYWLVIDEEGETPQFCLPDTEQGGWKVQGQFIPCSLKLADRVSCWPQNDYQDVYLGLSEDLDMPLSEVSLKFGEVSLSEKEAGVWNYHPLLGIFGAPE
ncbi:type I-F CRISPR-associated helicase Cas3f [Tatumella sp. UBA2305]|uniref:type I-F CRISPR-associated helicase Cas3f n=1 Tax=Tatumella sp. UBA2305 TaxID=1947647 RepID=UPI0025D3B57D|nr:type I-F CRISPR-associated helicase Cas3f [Tatumella sp. UBA2305]